MDAKTFSPTQLLARVMETRGFTLITRDTFQPITNTVTLMRYCNHVTLFYNLNNLQSSKKKTFIHDRQNGFHEYE